MIEVFQEVNDVLSTIRKEKVHYLVLLLLELKEIKTVKEHGLIVQTIN